MSMHIMVQIFNIVLVFSVRNIIFCTEVKLYFLKNRFEQILCYNAFHFKYKQTQECKLLKKLDYDPYLWKFESIPL